MAEGNFDASNSPYGLFTLFVRLCEATTSKQFADESSGILELFHLLWEVAYSPDCPDAQMRWPDIHVTIAEAAYTGLNILQRSPAATQQSKESVGRLCWVVGLASRCWVRAFSEAAQQQVKLKMAQQLLSTGKHTKLSPVGNGWNQSEHAHRTMHICCAVCPPFTPVVDFASYLITSACTALHLYC